MTCETTSCNPQSLLQKTKLGDIARVTLIKGSGIYENIQVLAVRGRSTSSDVSSDISPSPLYIPPHRRQPKTECTRGSDTGVR